MPKNFPSPRPVVQLSYDGKIERRFASVSAAARYFHRCPVAIMRSCQSSVHLCLCCGYRFLYAEDYIPTADYHYRPHPDRDTRGRTTTQPACLRFLSPQTKARLSASRSANAKRLCADPNSRFGVHSYGIASARHTAVLCITTGQVFPSQLGAAAAIHCSRSHFCHCLKRNKPLPGGLRFRPISDEEYQQRLAAPAAPINPK